jgi:Reverse transcriptase (RNA-dependent DNA polymerase)
MLVQACYLCEVEKRRNINCGIVCRRTDLYGNSLKMMEEFKGAVMKEFEMTDLGLIKYFLGLEVKQHEKSIFVSREIYAKEILKRFGMENYNPIATPMKLDTKLSRYDE